MNNQLNSQFLISIEQASGSDIKELRKFLGEASAKLDIRTQHVIEQQRKHLDELLGTQTNIIPKPSRLTQSTVVSAIDALMIERAEISIDEVNAFLVKNNGYVGTRNRVHAHMKSLVAEGMLIVKKDESSTTPFGKNLYRRNNA